MYMFRQTGSDEASADISLNLTRVPLSWRIALRLRRLFLLLLLLPVREIMATRERKKAAPAMAKSSVKSAVESTTSGQHSSPP